MIHNSICVFGNLSREKKKVCGQASNKLKREIIEKIYMGFIRQNFFLETCATSMSIRGIVVTVFFSGQSVYHDPFLFLFQPFLVRNSLQHFISLEVRLQQPIARKNYGTERKMPSTVRIYICEFHQSYFQTNYMREIINWNFVF